TKDQTKAAFSQGKIAMLFNVNNGGKTIRTVMEEAGRTNIRTISWPTMAAGECDYVLGGCDGYFISSNTKNPEASINILKYLTSKEAFELQVDDGDVVPANVEGGTDEEFARDSSKVYPKEIMAISAEMNDYINYNIGANYFYDKEGTLEELESLRTSAQ
ncbi:extracellular solute-binding protein, partial [Hungatella sp.]